MNNEEFLILLERESEKIKFEDPIDSTQWAYNEGIVDLIVRLEQILETNKQIKI